jgi:hypothetical protein
MFVQVISGQVADVEGLRRQHERWLAELKPGAAGYLGSTGGVTADGRSVQVVRFESEAAARANSDRPEQGAWWAETEKCYAEAPQFAESTDVDTFLAGGRDDARFVQVMRGRAVDRARLRELDQQFEALAPAHRPDLLGGLRVWTGPDTFVETAYFVDEAAARKGESTEPPPEVASVLGQWQDVIAEMEFLDLNDPIID